MFYMDVRPTYGFCCRTYFIVELLDRKETNKVYNERNVWLPHRQPNSK